MYVKASQAAGPRVALRVAPYVFPRPRYPIVMLCPAVSTYWWVPASGAPTAPKRYKPCILRQRAGLSPHFAEAMEELPTLRQVHCVHVTPDTSAAFAENIQKDGITLMDASSKKAVQLTSATGRLREALEEYRHPGSKTVRDGVAQRFAFCAELAWKAARDYLDVNSPKTVMRKAYTKGTVSGEQAWLSLPGARNKTSHLCDDQVADAVCPALASSCLSLLHRLSDLLSTQPSLPAQGCPPKKDTP